MLFLIHGNGIDKKDNAKDNAKDENEIKIRF